jgi:F0F1-type ATP synthase epsilon subunit
MSESPKKTRAHAQAAPEIGTTVKGKTSQKDQKKGPVHDVAQLDQKLRDLVCKLLVEGATFEDTAATIQESAGEKLTVRAVENFFRADLGIQEERIKRQVLLARKLKRALRNPDSAHAELAEAVLFTGLMGLHNNTAGVSMQSAVRLKSQDESTRLKQDSQQLRKAKFQTDQQMAQIRRKHELKKLEMLKDKVKKLKQEFEDKDEGQRVKPETIKRIQEIYGLLSEPSSSKENNAQASGA